MARFVKIGAYWINPELVTAVGGYEYGGQTSSYIYTNREVCFTVNEKLETVLEKLQS
jgi:hypothetical protein